MSFGAGVGAWLAQVDKACTTHSTSETTRRHGPAIALVVAAISLTLLEYSAGYRAFQSLLRITADVVPSSAESVTALLDSRWYALCELSYWVLTRALGFAVLPALVIRYWLREPLSAYGLRLAGLRQHLAVYAGLYLLVLPALWLAAHQPAFTSYYPFYRRAGQSWVDLVVWEGLYALQFFCVELFFRGFLLRALTPSMGSHALFVAMVPYVMVHFSKPMLEVLGAIPAGIVLGALAVRTGSIWGGVLLHVAVAWTMDALALLQTTGLPASAWPIVRPGG